MNWKEFLKPTLGKVAIYFIIFIIPYFLTLFVCKTTYEFNEECPSILSYFEDILPIYNMYFLYLPLLIFYIPVNYILCILTGSQQICSLGSGFVRIGAHIFVLILYYTISCLIIFIYNKIKKNKKR